MDSFLWKIYIYRFLDAFKLIGVIFTLLFQHNGLNPFQISLLIGIWSATQLLLEVPLGVLADKFSRRDLLIIAVVLLAIGFSFWLHGGFVFYALGFILWGVKNALTSGTLESFVYDELNNYDKVELYEKVNGKMEGAFWIGVMLSAAFGGLIAEISFNLVLISSITTSILSGLTLLTIRNVKATRSTGETKYFIVLKKALKEIKHNSRLLQIIVFICLIFAVYGAADEYWPLIFNDFGINLGFVGILVALVYGSFSLAGYTIHLFDSNKFKNIDYFLIAISGILFITVGLIKSVYLLPLVFLGIYLFKIANIKFDAKFQHSIQSDQRATVSSLKSLSFEIVYLLFVVTFGFISTKLGLTSVLYLLGGLILFWVIILRPKLNH